MIREIDLADAMALFGYWADHPPPGDMMRVLGALWGWKPPRRANPREAPRSILADFPQGR